MKEEIAKQNRYNKKDYHYALREGESVHAHYLLGICDGLQEASNIIMKLEAEAAFQEMDKQK